MGGLLLEWEAVQWNLGTPPRRVVDMWRRSARTASPPGTAEPGPKESDLLREVSLLSVLQGRLARARRRPGGDALCLRAWQACDAFALAVHRAAACLESEYSRELARRFLDAARDAHRNVVEGCAHRSPANALFFLRRARTLLDEAADLITAARRAGCLCDALERKLLCLHREAERALDGLIASLACVAS